MNKDEYLKDPCKASSLSFWKTNNFVVPSFVHVVRDDLFDKALNVNDEQYFKVINYLNNIEKPDLPKSFVDCSDSVSFKDFANHINSCYLKEHVTEEEVASYKEHLTYKKELWIAIKDIKTNEVVGTAIGEFDSSINEGIIEWVQVSNDYRRKGIGKYLVNSLLIKMKEYADFVIVSGNLNNPSNPLKLYLSCGFKNKVIWHIYNKD